MGFQFNDDSDNVLGKIKVIEPEIWRGATHFISNDGYGQNFYINSAAQPQVQQNNTDLQSESYYNPYLHVYNCINDYCVYYNNKWFKPLSIIEVPTFSATRTDFKADDFNNNTNNIHYNSLIHNNIGDGENVHYGFYIKMLNFGNSDSERRPFDHQQLQYTSGNDYFQLNRHNNVNGNGILLWRINTNRHEQHNISFTNTDASNLTQKNVFHLNPGKVCIIDTT